MLTGIDVSQHQGSFDWKQVPKQGHVFAFVKASEGVGFRDPQFTRNWEESAAVGLLVGAYHFARVSRVLGSVEEDAKREAGWFARQIGDVSRRLPPVLDLEWDSRAKDIKPEETIRWAKAFLAELTKLTGRTPIVYTGPSFWRYKLVKSLDLAAYPLWEANYTSAAKPKAIPGWPWTFWQWTSTHPIGKQKIDANRYGGSMADLEMLAGVVATTPDAQTTKVDTLPYPDPMSLLDKLTSWLAQQTATTRSDRAKP